MAFFTKNPYLNKVNTTVKDRLLEEKDQVIEYMVRKMHQSGTSLEEIAKFSGMTVEEVEAILKRSSDQEH